MDGHIWTPAVWVQLGVGVATVLATIVVTGLSALLVNRSGKRSEWWRRTEWAMSFAAVTDDDRRQVGIRILAKQTRSALVNHDEQSLAMEAFDVLARWPDDSVDEGTTDGSK